MTYKAFVSSTYIDLKDHRACVIKALRKAGIHVDPMEDWTADSDEPKQVSVERMRDCDFCILLVGARRGHVPENEILSITQMEVQEAEKRGIDVLVFLYDGKSAWCPEYYELDKDDELKRWRTDLMEHKCTSAFTCDPSSLKAPVRDAVSRWLQKQEWPEVHKTYLETLRDAHAAIRFLGIGQYKDIQDRPIDSLFVDPLLSTQHISPDTPPEKWPETSSLYDLVSAEQRLVLLGDPGCGKSTLISWIVWNLARDGENRWKQAMKNRTPLVMVLRELSLNQVRTWDELLAAYFEHYTARLFGRPRYASDVRALLEDGRAMILLDGLDEVGNPKVQQNLRQAVWEGMRRYGECAWLLTSRVVGYIGYHEARQPDGPDGAGGRHIPYAQLRYVAPFADSQIKQFAQNWFTSRDQSAVRASENAKKLVDDIHANPYTLRLARIPNLLMMMALIHRERVRLPHGRALLYNDIATAYLQSIDEHRRIEHLGYSLRDQKQWLGRIGFEMQMRRQGKLEQGGYDEEKEILVEGRDVRQWVVSAMRDAGRTDSSEEAAAAFLDEICRRSGLLLPRGADQFAFTHLSFQEYFAAFFFMPQVMLPKRHIQSKGVSGARPEDLHAYAGNPMWHETLIFLVELIFADHPDWLEEVLFYFFGEDFSDVTLLLNSEQGKEDQGSEDDARYDKAILLAKFAVNPHAGLEENNLKKSAITLCCALEAKHQKKHEEVIRHSVTIKPFGLILNTLLDGTPNERSNVWKIFGEAIQKADVRALNFWFTPTDGMSEIPNKSTLEVLHFLQSDIKDLAFLKNFVSLRKLFLVGTAVREVRSLAALTGLQELIIFAGNVSDLRPLAALTGLQKLEIRSVQLSDVGPLQKLTGLQELDLSDTQVCDVEPLSKLSGLKVLYLSGTQISDVGPLASLIGLQKLDLSGTQISDVGPLASLIELQELDLSGTQISDVGPLASLIELQELDLSGTQISDVGPLASLIELKELDLSDTPISDVGPLTGLIGLEKLTLNGTQRSYEDIQTLWEALPKCFISS